MTYNLCKKITTNGNFDKADMLNKLDVFLLSNRITQEQYEELIASLESKPKNKFLFGWGLPRKGGENETKAK